MAPLEINKHLIILAVTIIIVTSAEIPVQGENLLIRFTEQSWIWWCKGSRNRNSWLVHQNLSGLLAGPLEWYYDCKWVLQGHWKTIKVSQISQFRYSLTNSKLHCLIVQEQEPSTTTGSRFNGSTQKLAADTTLWKAFWLLGHESVTLYSCRSLICCGDVSLCRGWNCVCWELNCAYNSLWALKINGIHTPAP